ncbi:hypothetical protein [Frigoribacterium endophyticum]|uniref:hypothetical protein n=1 Tax=Frigoribacterium endophyticum TaxID=1522176 RepID=UPI0014249C35|nr:hypothetical protein [Frigoribacterium endophyticum]NII50373.1 hypothetical protein [Frigoribacterium endophyticum]
MTAMTVPALRAATPAEGGRRTLPISAVDRLAAGAHVLGVMGPLVLPPRAALVAALHRVVSLGPGARLGLVAADRRDWAWTPETQRELCERMVREIPPLGDDLAPDEVLEHLVGMIDDALPLQVILSGERLLMIYDHQVVDARFTSRLPAALLDLAAGGEMPAWLSAEGVRHPLWRAVAATYLRHPARVPALLRARRVQVPTVPTGVVQEREQVAWAPSTAVAWGRGERRTFTELRRWLRAQPHPVAFSSAVIVALRAAFVREGVRLAAESELVWDVRQYLPAGVDTTGNFVTGVPVTGVDDLLAVDESIHETVTSGRPLAALVAGAVKEAVRPGDRRVPATAPAHARGHLVVSNLGVARTMQGLPWVRDGRPAELGYTVHPVPAENLSVQIAVIDGALQVAVAYNDNVFDRGVVDRALARFVADPLSLIDGAPGS